MSDPAEPILERIREHGYEVNVGTKGYQIHLVVKNEYGIEIDVVEDDTYVAAKKALEKIEAM